MSKRIPCDFQWNKFLSEQLNNPSKEEQQIYSDFNRILIRLDDREESYKFIAELNNKSVQDIKKIISKF